MKKKTKKDCLIIVAHPDDETIWMGGSILRNKKKWNTSIVCMCRKDDPDRAPKFRKVCMVYNARSFISDLDDEKLNDMETEEVKSRLPGWVAKQEWDLIYTHNKNGEYGHKRHKIVHFAVEEMLQEGILKSKKVFFFDYYTARGLAFPRARADKFINLNDIELSSKKNVIKNIYGFDEKSFEVKCSRKKESFKLRPKKI